MCEWFIYEDESSAATLVGHESHQEDERLDHLLATGSLAVVEANHSLLIKFKLHLKPSLAQDSIIVFQARILDLDLHVCESTEASELSCVLSYRVTEQLDVLRARLIRRLNGTSQP